jgi:lipopolysaccharide/colanic/teichoic acid biosynthesis glycosyltransferase
MAAFYEGFFSASPTHWAILGNFLAACASVYLVRNLSLYPGIRGVFFSLPSVLTSFALTFSCFLLFRVDYSRALLLSGAMATLAWLYIAQFMAGRGPPVQAGIVPFGSVSMLSEVSFLRIQTLAAPILSRQFDILVADFRADLPDQWQAFLADCALAGVPVLHVKQLHEALTGRVEIEHLSENSFGSLIPYIAYLRLRGVIDFVIALVVGLLLLPAFVVIAILIKMDSPGPLLFRQVRVGYRGQPFLIAKFRTMVVASHETDQADESQERDGASTRDNDPRITRLGRVLRRWRIDELPQILNILKGEMSWIGPRPEAVALSRWYESELPFYRYRHIVPPGITGWAQVNQGHVVELDQVMSKLHYDFYYIKNFSPFLDALIVAKTVSTMLTGFGSR